MSCRFFGTDGIRGLVGKEPITNSFALKLGSAIGNVLKNTGENSLAIIGQDGRKSGDCFVHALASGLMGVGVDVINVGLNPTPAIAYMTKFYNASIGVVVSASHNPFYDNGIKFFSNKGEKLTNKVEIEIESYLFNDIKMNETENIGSYTVLSESNPYLDYLSNYFSDKKLDLSNFKICIDCANGAMSNIAEKLFLKFKSSPIIINNIPNGININDNCGSVYPETLQNEVLSNKSDLGIAFDGDGDRLQIIASDGMIIDGDDILYIISKYLNEHESLPIVIGTLMTNFGIEKALLKENIKLIRANVGDKYVLSEMKKHNSKIGAESSGHVILQYINTTGDGLSCSLMLLLIMQKTKKSILELLKDRIKTPQYMINVPLNKKITSYDISLLDEDVKNIKTLLSGNGRVLLRASGTEPVLRVMVESDCIKISKKHANILADIVKEKLY